MTRELTKQEKIDAAVAVVEKNAQAALADLGGGDSLVRSEYTEAYQVASVLEREGVLVRVEGRDFAAKEAAERRLNGQAKRLLDEEAAKPDARILRFSSRDGEPLPRLNGWRRHLHGAAVGYTTPELYERALMAVQARLDQERAEELEIASLLDQAAAAGFPKPKTATRLTVTYDLDGLRALLVLAAQ